MAERLNIGIVGLDTSHVVKFAELFNDETQEFHVAGGKITIAYPGGSPDFPFAYDRIPKFTQQLRDDYGVKITESVEQVAENCDAILLESADGRVHLEQFRKLAPYRKPVFIDKPLAVSSQDAEAIMALADEYGTPVLSSSSLRFSDILQQKIKNGNGDIIGADCFGPVNLQPTQPGFFWYGIHSIEMLHAVMGPGCVSLRTTTNEDYDQITGVWKDGRIGTVRGNRRGSREYGCLIHRPKSVDYVDIRAERKPYFNCMAEAIIEMFRTGVSPLPMNETLQVIRFIEAANESRLTGETVRLAEGSGTSG
jgi:predicted dehydrogenase